MVEKQYISNSNTKSVIVDISILKTGIYDLTKWQCVISVAKSQYNQRAKPGVTDFANQNR